MSLLHALKRAFIGDAGDAALLDYLPVTEQKLPPTPTVANPRPVPSEPPDWEKKRREAAQKLGKPFAPDIKTSRVTAPSHMLEHITKQSDEAKRERGPLRLAARGVKR